MAPGALARTPQAILLALYLGAFAVAEASARLGAPQLAAVLDAAIAIIALNQATASSDRGGPLLLGLALVAASRLLTLATLVVDVSELGRILLVSGPILLGTFLAARRTGWSRQRLGISFDAEVALVAILALGIGLVAGFITYAIFEPLPPIVDLDLRRAALPGVVLVVSAGIVEELLFRGLLQVAASELLGARVGTLFIAVLWTLAAVAPWSQTGLVAGFAIALGLAALTSQARSVIPAMAAHAGLVVSALLIAPFLQPGGPLS